MGRHLMTWLVAIVAMSTAGVANAVVLLQDDFSGGSVDTGKWTTRENFGGAGGAVNNVIDSGRLHQFNNMQVTGSTTQEIITNSSYSSSDLHISLEIEKTSGEINNHYTAIQYGDDSNTKVAWAVRFRIGGVVEIMSMADPGGNWALFTTAANMTYSADTVIQFDSWTNTAGDETTIRLTEGASFQEVTISHIARTSEQLLIWSWESNDGNTTGAFIDNVLIETIPEPASLVLMSLGALVLGRQK